MLDPLTSFAAGWRGGFVRGGVAALVSRHGLEHNTIQYAPDGVIAAISGLMLIAPGPYVPEAFTNSGMGVGTTWGLCHFRNLGGQPGKGKIIVFWRALIAI